MLGIGGKGEQISASWNFYFNEDKQTTNKQLHSTHSTPSSVGCYGAR